MISATRLTLDGRAKSGQPQVAPRMALLDSRGKIIAVNKSWLTFARQSGTRHSVRPGADYLEVCRKGEFPAGSGRAIAGIIEVIEQRSPWFSIDYSRETPSGLTCFRMDVAQIQHQDARAAISHTDITDLVTRTQSNRSQLLIGGVIKAQEEERLRISRELHDDVGGRIALLVCSVRRFVADLPKESHKIESELRGTIQGLIDLSMSLRNISHALHPPSLLYVGLGAALKSLTEAFRKASGIQMDIFISRDLPRLPDDLELAIFRIAQESLQNIEKHSGAKHGRITLGCISKQIHLSISDSGKGFVESEGLCSGGVGLLSMQERAIGIGGCLTLNTTTGKGTEISLIVPTQKRTEGAAGTVSTAVIRGPRDRKAARRPA